MSFLTFGNMTTRNASKDDEAVRRKREQSRTLLFADCRNPFEDVAIAARMRQILHTHQGRDKVFKCIMYFLRIYMWMKNIKLNFMFIGGANEEDFTLVERNYMTIMNSRRLFRLGRFVGEWVRIQVTLLKSSQLIYSPSKSRSMSYFVQIQMVLDVMARLLLFAKCITDDLAYVSQKGFLHSAIAGKLLYVGARLAVPVMTSDLFLNSLNLAQRVLDSRHVVSVKENPDFAAFHEQQLLEQQQQQESAALNGIADSMAGTTNNGAAMLASNSNLNAGLLLGSGSNLNVNATLLHSTNPYASFETLPKTSYDDFSETMRNGGAALMGSSRNLKALSNTNSTNNATFVTSREGTHSHLSGNIVTATTVAYTSATSAASATSVGRTSRGGLLSHDSIHVPTSGLATPVMAMNTTAAAATSGGPPPLNLADHDDDNAAASASSPLNSQPQKGMRTSLSAQHLDNSPSSSANSKGQFSNNNNGSSNATMMRKSKSMGVLSAAYGDDLTAASPVVVSAAVTAEDPQKSRVGRSFSLLYTLNDLDRKRKGIQKQQEAMKHQQHAAAAMHHQQQQQQMAAAAAAAMSPTLANNSAMASHDFPTMGSGVNSVGEPAHSASNHYDSPARLAAPPAGPTSGLSSPSVRGSVDAHTIVSTTAADVPVSSVPLNYAAEAATALMPHHNRTQSGRVAGMGGVGGGTLATYVHALYHPQLDPNNADERDAVMKAAEESDLLDLLAKNDGDEVGHHPNIIFNASSLRHLQGAVNVNRTYAPDTTAAHHHGDDGEASSLLRVKSEAWTEQQILEGTFSAPREYRLKAIATSIAAQRRRMKRQQQSEMHLQQQRRASGIYEEPAAEVGGDSSVAGSVPNNGNDSAAAGAAGGVENATAPKKGNNNNNNRRQRRNNKKGATAAAGAAADADMSNDVVAGDSSNHLDDGLNDDTSSAATHHRTMVEELADINTSIAAITASANYAMDDVFRHAAGTVGFAAPATALSATTDLSRLLPADHHLSSGIKGSKPPSPRLLAALPTSSSSPRCVAATASGPSSLQILSSGPSSFQDNPPHSNISKHTANNGSFATNNNNSSVGYGMVVPESSQQQTQQQQNCNATAESFSSTVINNSTAAPQQAGRGLVSGKYAAALTKPPPTSALAARGAATISAAAQLKMAIERSIETYSREVSASQGLTPVNNYAELLWRDYELHWACVTQLKLILDYYVLLSVVFNWEGVRGRTAVMGLVSGLLSVYRVFVYGR